LVGDDGDGGTLDPATTTWVREKMAKRRRKDRHHLEEKSIQSLLLDCDTAVAVVVVVHC
jgi:hypothetical protein